MRSSATPGVGQRDLAPTHQKVYPARIDHENRRVKGPYLDGDSFVMERKLLDESRTLKQGEVHVRLLEVDTPEVRGPTKEAGFAAASFTYLWLQSVERTGGAWPFLLQTTVDDSFGRVLSYVFARETGEALHEAILEAGHSERVSAMMQIREA